MPFKQCSLSTPSWKEPETRIFFYLPELHRLVVCQIAICFLNLKAAKLRMRTRVFYRVQSRCLVSTSTGKAYHHTNAIRTTYQKESVLLASCTVKPPPDDCKWPKPAPCSRRPCLCRLSHPDHRKCIRNGTSPLEASFLPGPSHSFQTEFARGKAFGNSVAPPPFVCVNYYKVLPSPFKDSQPWCC